jgi:hypothetical protein
MLFDQNTQGLTAIMLLASVDAADTAAATGTGVDISAYDGSLIICQNCGLLDAGTLTGSIITSASSDLSDPTTVHTFTAVTTSTDPSAQYASINTNELKQYIGYIGTIATGGALISCTAVGAKKYA